MSGGLQRTLALIKPDAVEKADDIVEAAMQAGFTVLEVCLHPFSLHSAAAV
jgi:nucleoside diphosphate kinase